MARGRAPACSWSTRRALAAMEGRGSVSTDHIRALALPLLRHRILLNYRGLSDGVRVEALIEEILRRLDDA